MCPSPEEPTADPDEDRVPPYEGRTEARGQSGHEGAASVERQTGDADGTTTGATASPATESQARGDETTDEAPPSPKGVGESTTRRGEDIQGDEGKERGRHEGPPEHESQRPTGYSDDRDDTSVD